MRYDDIRQHVREYFIDLLSKFRETVSVDGPMEGLRLDGLKTSQKLADEPLEHFTATRNREGFP